MRSKAVGRSSENRHVLVDVHYVYLAVVIVQLVDVISLTANSSKLADINFNVTNAIFASTEDERKAICRHDIILVVD